jgi:CheY-like chemotaxis protein
MSTVLVVDDEGALLQMIATVVEDIGHRAIVATNGHDALAVLQSEPEPPALIVSDVMMPKMDGVTLARALRSEPRFRDVPIVLMSAAGCPIHGDIADQFLHKPLDLDLFERLVERYAGEQALQVGSMMVSRLG